MEQLQFIQDHTKCDCCLDPFHFEPQTDDDATQQQPHRLSVAPMTGSRAPGTSASSRRYQHALSIQTTMASFKASQKNTKTKTNKKIKNKSGNKKIEPAKSRYPVTSCACNHIICKPCLIQYDVRSASNCDVRRRASSRFMACPLCQAPKSFSKRFTIDQSLMDGLKHTSTSASEDTTPTSSRGPISSVGAYRGHGSVKATIKIRSQSRDAAGMDADPENGGVDSDAFRKGYMKAGTDPMTVPLTTWPLLLDRINGVFGDDGRGSCPTATEDDKTTHREEAAETVTTAALPALSDYSVNLRLNMLHDMIRLGVTQNTELYGCIQAR
uniref:RING-type domain-containing protein n=2 Tax=Craspedostauros australis TaxID=1486917 RepID=A0A7R9ZLU7_9STRA|mmetsp:Transcript_18303/g.50809  ORF Transcript_18303/g.50809 Transcript_18303/m.50809 type:complete len:326 (+) Transcript_18303:276-1253(+)|eukprot:CAMPEP_0198120422 /NCGR_PEP_ID=MMETSP1442-20131203/28979_1 /TAXON_ID= /ORGANISM="Craspedostauros australis, Strain CCMP3328" /LENGTH=325 /DNA_ID=CAMNT_0043779071 /DNA_START=258 /DNA_END=1235 /DNA_ORIENTATION=+